MDKYLIVSKDSRIPPDIEGSSYDMWSREQFIEAASGDGIEITNGLYLNIDSLDKDLYEALKSGIDIPIIYYKFADQSISLDFKLEEGLINYDVKSEEPEVIPTSEVVTEPQPIVQPPEPVAPPVQEVTPIPAEIEVPEVPQPTVTPPPVIRETPEPPQTIGDLDVMSSEEPKINRNDLNILNIENLLNTDSVDVEQKTRKTPAKVILFGSSKGGTGKTFTCLLSAYRYAKTHPTERVALADFDIIDGQIGITINKNNPTLADFYKQYVGGNREFTHLANTIVKNDHFNSNLDFYLAPPMDVPEITNDTQFWQTVFELLIKNYDTVFFDSGIDYLGKPPISRLYKIADKIILTSNTSINSVKSIIRQLQTISGRRKNNVFNSDMHILDRVNIVLTRVSSNNATNDIVIDNLSRFAPIVAAFGNIDDLISKSQWYQQWELWDWEDKVNSYLDEITRLD